MFTPQVILQTILVFFVLVTIHEWGHYYFAKRAGILVREFAIGFGPKLFSYKKGETRYTLRLLPLGGYVRMAGEDPEIVHINVGQTIAVLSDNQTVTHLYLDQLDQRMNVTQGTVEQIDLENKLTLTLNVDGEFIHYTVDPQAFMISKNKETQIAPLNRQFSSKSIGQRSLSIFAGPMMNFILAFVLFLVNAYMMGAPVNVKLGSVEADSAALSAGLKVNDIILSVNGTAIGTDTNKLIGLIQKAPNQKMIWIIERNKEQMRVEVTPNNKSGMGFVGFRPDSDTRHVSIAEGIQTTVSTMGTATSTILTGFKTLVTLQFKLDDLGGPVRIVEVTGQFAERGLASLIFWGAILSLYLGLFNLLPFPALDGSRLLFLGLEAVRGKPVDPNRESMVHFIGFAMLMLLMLAVTYNDIIRLFKG